MFVVRSGSSFFELGLRAGAARTLVQVEQRAAMDQTAIVDVTAIPAGDGMTVTADAAKAMIAAEKRNGLVLRGFVKGAVRDSDHHVLQGWAKEVCTALQRHDECFK